MAKTNNYEFTEDLKFTMLFKILTIRKNTEYLTLDFYEKEEITSIVLLLM